LLRDIHDFTYCITYVTAVVSLQALTYTTVQFTRSHFYKYHQGLLNHFCGFKSAYRTSWWNFQWTFLK